jgi:cardiolipin synthase A/B
MNLLRKRGGGYLENPDAPPGTPLGSDAFLGRRRDRWRSVHQVTPLRAGAQTYPAMLTAITNAKLSICLETYIFADDQTGNMFAAALIDRAVAGVKVRIIYDAVGSMGFAPLAARLAAAGAQLVEFHPIAPWRKRWNLSHRDHRKILVVDDSIAFVGGLNIGNDYADIKDGGVGWHDLHCRLTGSVVIDLARLFRRTWLSHDGELYDAAPMADEGNQGDAVVAPAVRLLENGPLRRKRVIEGAYLRAISLARQRIQLKNAYFLPGRNLRRALALAARRGISISVIVPNRSDVRLVEWASLYAFRRVMATGVKVWRWRGPMMHAKSAVVDGLWSTIGSYNFDARSLRYNLEVAVEIVDPITGAQLSTSFADDVSTCDEFTLTDWKRLSWWTKALAWLSYRLRRWL